MIQTTVFSLVGITPLLMNRYTGDEEKVKNFDKLNEQEAMDYARQHAYLKGDGSPYIPGENLMQALISGGKFVKGKGRGNLSRTVAAGMRVTETEIPIEGPTSVSLDRRMRKNPSTGGKMLNYRIRVEVPWSARVPIEWDDALLQRQDVLDIAENTGIRVGLMDWRPEKRGAFGQFRMAAS